MRQNDDPHLTNHSPYQRYGRSWVKSCGSFRPLRASAVCGRSMLVISLSRTCVADTTAGRSRWLVTEAQWRLAKNKKFGWELNIERPDGGLLGSYYGRRWRSGGGIELANGTRAELRRSPLRNRWQIRNTHGAVCDILSRAYVGNLATRRAADRMTVTFDLEPTGIGSLEIVVLTACGVIMLTDALAAAGARADGGR